ncbi:MAG TPA: hypothetical protein VFC99_05185 [Acidimicrobiia bacterium]|nr:hypothetical protein [Acidimicrobiia bacterium]
MPPAKKSTATKSARPAKKAGKRAVRKTTKTAAKRGPRKMSTAHKAALAEGRQVSAVVDRYLSALHVPKQRGRKVSPATLQARLEAAEAKLKHASGVARLTAAQDVRDLRNRLASLANSGAQDIKQLEAAFVRVAKKFGEKRGIGYGAWRDAGVPAPVLKKAGVRRTRGV